MKKVLASTLIAAAVAAAVPAQAYEAGEWIVRAGAATVDPRERATNVTVNGAALPASVGLDSDTQLGLTVSYMLSSNFAVEVLAATPFSHTISGTGALSGVTVGETKHLPPTVSLQWFPADSSSNFQPYLGIGLNYTTFFDESVDSQLEAMIGAADMKIDDSFGVALEAGFDYWLTENLALNAAVWRIDIDTDATIKSAAAVVKTDVKIDPMAYMIGVAYKF